MNTTQAAQARKVKPDGLMFGSIAFQSTCPKCAQVRPQRGYDRDCLLRLLNGGHPVEAYCESCDKFWPISTRERAQLAMVVMLAAA